MKHTILLLASLLAIAGCADSSFRDCAVSCTADTGCPPGLTCGAEGFCRTAGDSPSCASLPGGGFVNSNASDLGN